MNQNWSWNKTNFHMKGFTLGLALKQAKCNCCTVGNRQILYVKTKWHSILKTTQMKRLVYTKFLGWPLYHALVSYFWSLQMGYFQFFSLFFFSDLQLWNLAALATQVFSTCSFLWHDSLVNIKCMPIHCTYSNKRTTPWKHSLTSWNPLSPLSSLSL